MLENQHPGYILDLPELRRFLTRARRAAGGLPAPQVRLLDDEAMRRLNRQFRAHDTPTDVLSFEASGDLAISLDTAARQARRRRHSLELEVRILLLHGLLHLAGYDHETDQGEMRLRERELRRQLGLPAGLIERGARRARPGGKKDA